MERKKKERKERKKKKKKFAFSELVKIARLRLQDSRPLWGIYFDLLTYSSTPKRIGGRRDLPAGTSEFGSSTSRIAKVFGLFLAFSAGTRGLLSSVILSWLSVSSICWYVAIGGEGGPGDNSSYGWLITRSSFSLWLSSITTGNFSKVTRGLLQFACVSAEVLLKTWKGRSSSYLSDSSLRLGISLYSGVGLAAFLFEQRTSGSPMYGFNGLKWTLVHLSGRPLLQILYVTSLVLFSTSWGPCHGK